MWTVEENKNKTKNRRNSQQLVPNVTDSNSNTGINKLQTTNQKFPNAKITAKVACHGHEGKYTQSFSVPNLAQR